MDCDDADLFSAQLPNSGVRLQLDWDAENRLVRVAPESGREQSGDVKVEFGYDYRNRRVAKRVYTWDGAEWDLTASRKYVWDGWRLLLELDAGGETLMVLRAYTTGLDLAGQNGQINSLESAGAIGGLLAAYDPAANRPLWYFYDANGNVGQVVTMFVDEGTVYGDLIPAARYEYELYGSQINARAANEYEEPLRFSTKPWDPETGMGYWGYRYYSPALGRWISRDPRHELGDVDLYRFCRSNPMSSVDALGEVPIAIPIAGGISIAEAVAAGFGLTLSACLATPECRAAVVAALQDAARSAAEAAKRAARRCQRVLCKYRNPTWMASPPDVTDDPMTAVARAAPSSPDYAGPYPQACRPDGAAHNCPGGAPGMRFYCSVMYKDRFNKLHAKKWSVNCCSCCYLFASGTSCKALHVAGKDKSPLPQGPP